MKRKGFMGSIAGVLVVCLAAVGLGFAPGASAQSDEEIIVGNLPAALEELSAGLQAAADVAAMTQSAVATGEAVGEAFEDFAAALVDGTEEFGQLGDGAGLLNGGLQRLLEPYLTAIDDPSTAGTLFNPDDLSTILDNLQPAIEDAEPHLKSAVAEALRGNLVEDLFGGFVPGVGTPAVLGDLLQATALGIPFLLSPGGFFVVLLDETNYETIPALLSTVNLLIGGLVGSQLHPVEDALAPVFDALSPATEPLAEAVLGL